MKILLLESLGGDYGAYFIARGFTKLLGPENVRMWPYKNTYEGGHDSYPERVVNGLHLQVQGDRIGYGPYRTGSELWNHPLFWRFWKTDKNIPSAPLPNDGPHSHIEPLDIPQASDDEIFDLIRSRAFDLIVLNGCRWHGSAALHELQAVFGSSLPPLAICDHDDYVQRRWDFVDAFQPATYFKRSMLIGGHPLENAFGHRPHVKIRPLPFSSMWNIPWRPWDDRDIDVFCVFGPTQIMRQKLKDVTVEEAAKHSGLHVMAALGHPMNHAEYLRTLARSKIVIDQQSFGTDTLRFWEAASAGCLLISDFNLQTPPSPIMPEQHFYKFDNDMSPAGDQQDFVKFRSALELAIRTPRTSETRASYLHQLVRASHTNQSRAQYILDEVGGPS